VYAFIDLFLAMESLLNLVSDSQMSGEDKCRAKSIRALRKKRACGQAGDLQCFLDKLVQRVRATLEETFNDLATTAKLQGCEADIEASPKFKRMRNVLAHGADEDVQQRVTVTEREGRTLSDLVEQYINWVLFKDGNVYRSRWRPLRVTRTEDNEGKEDGPKGIDNKYQPPRRLTRCWAKPTLPLSPGRCLRRSKCAAGASVTTREMTLTGCGCFQGI